jgi:gamma-glutamyltranspeptidase / glutathione hydrolase
MIRSTMLVTKRMPVARRGMVVAEHPLGAEAGASILERGGNAVDAAVATAFVMPVVEPFMSTLAGGGTMLVHLARRGETLCVDFNVEVPAAAHESSYQLGDGISSTAIFAWRRVVDDANVFGPRSVAVPGSVAGLCLALERWGTMELRDVIAPAIKLAEEGFIPDWYVALQTAIFCQELAAFPSTAKTYLRDGHYVYRTPVLNEGEIFRQPDLARSLRLLAKEGPAAFYTGAIAQAIHAEMLATGGMLTKDDLARYAPRVLPALRGKYRGLELAFSPGATGGTTALEMLNILAQFPKSLTTWKTPNGLHLRAEAIRRAFLDRLEHLGDAERVKAPWDALVSREYATKVAAELKPKRSLSARPAPDPWRYEVDARAADCTTHLCAVDRQRNMVSLTNTAVSLWGSRMVVPETGILLQNGMVWFDPEPGRVNSVAPGKRPLVNMVPALGFKRGDPYLAVGAPGGRKIVSAIPQVIANMVDLGDSPQAAIEAPRLHTEGGDLWVDDRLGDASLAALTRMGHPVVAKRVEPGTLYFSKPVAIRVTGKGLEAGLDPIHTAAAAGI